MRSSVIQQRGNQRWIAACRRRGWRGASASVLAMIYLMLMVVLAVAMSAMANLNVRSAYNQDAVERARANAETGLRWLTWRLQRVNMPTTLVGIVDATTARKLWNPSNGTGIVQLLQQDVAGLTPPPNCTITGGNNDVLAIGPVTLPGGGTFTVTATPASSVTPALPPPGNDARVIVVKATGTFGTARRAMAVQCLIQKTMRYAVISKSQIQLGKNTVVTGDIFVAAPPKSHQAPLVSISDFRYTSASTSDALTTQVQKFQDYLATHDVQHDNRVKLDSNPATAAAQLADIRSSNTTYLSGISDYNLDGYVDETDLFLKYFDTNADHRVRGAGSGTEFYAKAPLDSNLFYLCDQWLGKSYKPTDPSRAGFNDGYIDSSDPYAKIKGHVRIWETESALAARLASDGTLNGTTPTIASMLQGSIISPDGEAPVQFGQSDANDPAAQLAPDDFTMGAFLALSGSSAGSSVRPSSLPNPDAAAYYANTTVSATTNGSSYTVSGDANGTLDSAVISRLTSGGSTLHYTNKRVNGVYKNVLTSVTENVPYGSTGSPQSTYVRPVFSNVNFKNCIINRGTNALFVNCTFDGVTFVDGSRTMTDDNSTTYAAGNNLRFDNCTFTGPIAQGDKTATDSAGNKAPAPASPTLKTNKWQFTGNTTIDLTKPSKDGSTDSAALATIKQQATIMAPQTSIDMGSFSAPGQSSCSFQGIAVVGNMDIRGVASVDGTIIGLYNRTALDTMTLGYFGSADGSSTMGQPDPELSKVGAAYGRIQIRFNPYRTLPDGINFHVSLLPDLTTLREEDPS